MQLWINRHDWTSCNISIVLERKDGIKFISLSGPERSEFYTKAAHFLHESASSLPGTDKPFSYMDNARRVSNDFGIPVDTKTDT